MKMTKQQELAAMCAGVDKLARAMKAKLRAKARQGFRGGLDEANHHTVKHHLHSHYERFTGHRYVRSTCKDTLNSWEPQLHQARDVCNLVMMLWLQGGAK